MVGCNVKSKNSKVKRIQSLQHSFTYFSHPLISPLIN